ncbi:hypothetical protein HMPREF9065_01214 [Aggregatibacter sp. oral taxon 458 str. W10330]|nr:hypothetical protein HMPREF9065_01214 [Aggregatibacter sp. oral taxon 458 str. W10330]
MQLVARKYNNSAQKSSALLRRRRERADRTIDVSFGVNGGERGARLYRRVDRTLKVRSFF